MYQSNARPLQAKLQIGSPDDSFEKEADETAARVMRMPAPLLGRAQPQAVQSPTTGLLQSKPAGPSADNEERGSAGSAGLVSMVTRPEDEETDSGPSASGEASLQRKLLRRFEAPGQDPVEAPPIVDEALRYEGSPLDPATRNFFEPRFGIPLRDVRLHTDTLAARSAEAVNALAYTVGNHVVFGNSQYSPGSESGRHLLAHELTHVAQQSGVMRQVRRHAGLVPSVIHGGAFLRRKGKTTPTPENPPDSKKTGSIQGFIITPEEGSTYASGPTSPQLLAMTLKQLLGAAYTVAIRDKFLAEWGPGPLFDGAADVKGEIAKGGDKFKSVFIDPGAMRGIMRICRKIGAPITLSPQHQQLLEFGEAVKFAFKHLSFPKWFTEIIFINLMGNRGRLLSALSETLKNDTDPKKAASIAKVNDIVTDLQAPVFAVDEIRKDKALVDHDVYKSMWSPAGKGSASIAPEDRPAVTLVTAGLLAYASARPILTKQALDDSKSRKLLLDSYAVAARYRSTANPGKGDQQISDVPTQYTARPYPSTLSVYPEPMSSLYGSTRSEYGFNMSLEFPDIFSAFQFHHYDFKAFRVPDDKWTNVDKALAGKGKADSHWDMLNSRLARNSKYTDADLHAYADSLWDQLGMPGSAADLIHLNAIMRDLGTVFGSLFESFADPSYVARFTFEEEGLYIVRCVADWNPGSEVTLKRPPSVAYQPVFARDPDLLAEMRLQSQIAEIEDARIRLPKNKAELDKTTEPKRKKELEDERAQLLAITGGVEGMLTYQHDLLDKATDKQSASRADSVQDTLDTRKARGFGANTERLPAVYVSDSGQILDLLIEVRTKSYDPVTQTGDYEVNDATTPSSTSASASGPRREAIIEALTDLFKDSDYGRGKASVSLDGKLESIDVPTVSVGKLLMEAGANAATLLSIVAIAAAPFTGGLALMVPAMIIGAVASTYNIIHRAIDHTLHFDLALAMDVVNVVGAVVGAGAETRAGMQAIRLGTTAGKVLIVTGLGVMGTSVLLMSASVLEELDKTKDIPEGLRQAEVMKILGHFMLNAGIMVGGLLAAHARAQGEPTRTFDGWLEGLDEQTRDRVLKSQNEAEPSRNFWKIYKEMDPLVRELLSQCGSDCIPMDPPPSKADQTRIKNLADGLNPRALRTLKGLLHDNRTPAAMDAVLKGIEQARNEAPRSKGGAKKASAVEDAVLAKGTGADYLLANLTESRVEALDPANPGKWKRARQLADDIVKAGKLDIEALGKVLDNVKRIEGADPEELLQHLKKLSDVAGQIDGIDRILGPEGLGGGRNEFKGSRWTLRFLSESDLWGKVASFEDPVPGNLINRVVDVRLADGTRIELKSWASWHEFAGVGFSRQIMADWIPTHGLQDPMVWAFEPGPGIGTAADVIGKMNDALDQALANKWRGYEDAFAGRRVDAIKAKLPSIVTVGKKP